MPGPNLIVRPPNVSASYAKAYPAPGQNRRVAEWGTAMLYIDFCLFCLAIFADCIARPPELPWHD